MIEPAEIEAKLLAALPDAQIMLDDLTGTRDHYRLRIVSEAFEGKLTIKRHRLIYDALREEMKGPIHALTIEALAPSQVR